MEGRLGGTRVIGTSSSFSRSCPLPTLSNLQGKGAFGSVVKARNKIDSRIYAVKKIQLKTQQSDTNIFREVNALSRLSHRFIARYYTTWVETNENTGEGISSGGSTFASSDESNGNTSITFSVPASSASAPKSRSTDGDEDLTDNSASTASERHLPTNAGFTIDMSDFDTTTGEISGSRGSFPSIYFDRSGSPGGSTEESDEGSSGTDESEFDPLFQRDATTDVTGTGVTIGMRWPRARTRTATAVGTMRPVRTEVPPFGLMSGCLV